MKKKTLTAKRRTRADHVGEALAIYRESRGLSYDALEAMLHHAGHAVSVRTLKRLILRTHVPHTTTLAQVEAFLKNQGAPAKVKDRRFKPVHEGGRWASGSR